MDVFLSSIPTQNYGNSETNLSPFTRLAQSLQRPIDPSQGLHLNRTTRHGETHTHSTPRVVPKPALAVTKQVQDCMCLRPRAVTLIVICSLLQLLVSQTATRWNLSEITSKFEPISTVSFIVMTSNNYEHKNHICVYYTYACRISTFFINFSISYHYRTEELICAITTLFWLVKDVTSYSCTGPILHKIPTQKFRVLHQKASSQNFAVPIFIFRY